MTSAGSSPSAELLLSRCEAIARRMSGGSRGLGRDVRPEAYGPVGGGADPGVSVEQIAWEWDHVDDEAPAWYREMVSGEGRQVGEVVAEAESVAFARCGRAASARPDPRFRATLSSGRGVMLHGPVGTGKTTLAVGAARDLIESSAASGFVPCVRFWPTAALMDELRHEAACESSADARSECARCDLLVLDDLGKERMTDFAMEALFGIVDARYQSMRPTVVTTQFQAARLVSRLARGGDSDAAEAVVSRLAETCEQVEVGGTDRRVHG